MKPKKILICPLDWGLGHATRCIPIIDALLANGHDVSIAGNGESFTLLKQQYPELYHFELPGTSIHYKGSFFNAILRQSPKIIRNILREKRAIRRLQRKYKFDTIISDNRFGCRHKKVNSIFISHQINLIAPHLAKMANRLNHYYLNKFNTIWVPDTSENTYAGALSKTNRSNAISIGVLSRFKNIPKNNPDQLLVLISGPEPSRSDWEQRISDTLKNTSIKTIIVGGNINSEAYQIDNNVTHLPFLNQFEIEELLVKTKLVISRSGYSSIMDWITLNQNAILVPTPQQTEQEYLANHLKDNTLFTSISEDDIELNTIENIFKLTDADTSETDKLNLYSLIFSTL